MTPHRGLDVLLIRSAQAFPARIAIDDPGRATITYAELDRLSERVRDRLVQLGVRPGDRVGIHLHKSIDAIAALFGTLRAGAAYVPVDPDAPAARCAFILDNCAVAAVVTEPPNEDRLRAELDKLGRVPPMLSVSGSGDLLPLRATLDALDRTHPVAAASVTPPEAGSLAYILYTSGSTGKPKGVMLSHENALSFVDWCSELLQPTEADVFSSHAPLHFDLSILDVFVSLKHGATLVLIGDQLGKDPLALAPLIAEKRISVWYSTPSILSLLARHGKLDRYDYAALRAVLFAGEVFPVPQLRALRALWPNPRYLNLYGPTETNVCTWYELPAVTPPERTEPYPIGRACSHLRCCAVNADGRVIGAGEEGELVVSGPGVMQGYWNLPDQNARAFLEDGDGRWYRTGDLVVEDDNGDYIFRGRRDRMVKRRGNRVELGEIEAALVTHPSVREVAVVALNDPAAGVRIKAFVSVVGERGPSPIEWKQFCMGCLPRYMVPDFFGVVEKLPRTSTDKIDYQSLLMRS